MCRAGQVQQDREPRRPVHQGADRGPVGRPGDQVAFPVPRLGTGGGLRGPLADHRHAGDPVRTALARPAMRPAAPPAGPQHPGWQLAGQATQLGAVDRLVDRLVHDMPRRLARELPSQRLADLLRTPPLLQPVGHELAQRLVAGDLASPGPGPPPSGQLVRGERPVPPAARITVPPQLAADRRRAAVQPFRDRPHPGPGPAQVRDLHPLILRQIPWRDLAPDRPRGDHGRIMQPPAVPGCDCAAVSPPFPGLPVDPDDPGRLRITEALRDQPRELLTLLNLRRPTRPSSTSHRNPRTTRVLRRPLEIAPSCRGQFRLSQPDNT